MPDHHREALMGARSFGPCAACGKQMYADRSTAKSAARAHHPGIHMSSYPCASGYWHYGKLASTVVRGYGDRDASREYPPSVTRGGPR